MRRDIDELKPKAATLSLSFLVVRILTVRPKPHIGHIAALKARDKAGYTRSQQANAEAGGDRPAEPPTWSFKHACTRVLDNPCSVALAL